MRDRLKPALTLGATQILNEASAFLRNLVLARIIGVEQMGLAVAIALGIRIFEMIGDFGLERWLVQVRSTELHRVRGTVHLLQALKACLLMIAAMALAIPLSNVIQPDLDPSIFALAAVSIGIRGLVHCDYRERQRNRDYAGTLQTEVGSNVIALIATLPIAMLTRDYSAIAYASIVQAAALCLLSHFIARRAMSFATDIDTIRRALRFGFPIACNAALMFLAMQGDRLLVAIHFEPQVLAVFAIAAQLTLLPALAGARFLLMYDLPRFSRLVARKSERQQLFRNRMLAVTCIAAALALGLGTFGNAVVGFLYGPEFVAEPVVMTLLALTAAVRLIRAVPNTFLLAESRTSVLLACNLPRIFALLIALGAIANGAGLPMVVGIGALSEIVSLAIGLAIVSAISRKRSRLLPTPLRSS